jgi:hypothetical protein
LRNQLQPHKTLGFSLFSLLGVRTHPARPPPPTKMQTLYLTALLIVSKTSFTPHTHKRKELTKYCLSSLD